MRKVMLLLLAAFFIGAAHAAPSEKINVFVEGVKVID